jgi:hypothetical protein
MMSEEFPREIVDLEGASGSAYRFRLWPEGAAHQPIAGNYVCVRTEGRRYAIVHIGETLDLSLVRDQLPKRIRDAATHIYTRLNVARTTRCAEHEDLMLRRTVAKASAA